MLLAEDPTDLIHLSRRAEYYEKSENFAEALADVDTYLTLAPKDLNMQLRKTSLLKSAGQFDAALALLDELTTKLSHWAESPLKEKEIKTFWPKHSACEKKRFTQETLLQVLL